MKKKIAILGSTGSIGKTTLKLIKKNKNDFDIKLLTTYSNIKELSKQAEIFKVKNLIIISKKHYLLFKKKNSKKNLNIYNDFTKFNYIFRNKLDYVMASISGLIGLKPTLSIIRHTKKIAIANKESIICAWNLIYKELKKNKTKFIPVDSEHFSIWTLLGENKNNKVSKIYITASGGPFLNYPKNKFNKITPTKALNHPSWKMGKKISIDSATMMNKLFEVIEAQRIFNINLNKFEILIHPKSYLHAMVKFDSGIIKLLVHETSMLIPIFNSIYGNEDKKIVTKKIDLTKLNNFKLSKPDYKKFPCLKFINKISNNISLMETVLISANDELVNNFLNNKISFTSIYKILNKILNMNEFKNKKRFKPNSITEIITLSEQVRLKTSELCNKNKK